ncbi:uncharacterized protein N7496_008092 [Penicillium cataractarum]|uniref:Uncharacterized protein n=1 Tax=Penicillium cataractarum TaxID=2100454 RepID=A0A9W9RXQ1_9EURO|nr:uncharacterized protein N7496_008092 [Penicillium cataractarum]KAJ5368332.1 hypothetical protein N7496_008092 [Penicillium cataractarum]
MLSLTRKFSKSCYGQPGVPLSITCQGRSRVRIFSLTPMAISLSMKNISLADDRSGSTWTRSAVRRPWLEEILAS